MKKAIAICMTVLFTLALCACAAPSKQPEATTGGNAAPAQSSGKKTPGKNESNGSQPDQSEPLSTDPGDQSDPGDTNQTEWWGEYKCDDAGFAIEITRYNGIDFWADITFLRDGETMLAGTAVIDPEDKLKAKLEDVELRLAEDFSNIDLFTAEDSEWKHMRGSYTKLG